MGVRTRAMLAVGGALLVTAGALAQDFSAWSVRRGSRPPRALRSEGSRAKTAGTNATAGTNGTAAVKKAKPMPAPATVPEVPEAVIDDLAEAATNAVTRRDVASTRGTDTKGADTSGTNTKTNAVKSAAAKPKKARTRTRSASLTAARTYYDRKEGVVVFERDVHVDDEEYQMHADKAFVFLQGTNDLRRIVAVGHVALTNEMRRAYGTKASYYRDGGMVVLYGDATRPAEVRDESKSEAQVVKGSRIKFWIDSEQVEVLDADITTPTAGAGVKDIRKAIGR